MNKSNDMYKRLELGKADYNIYKQIKIYLFVF